jgi:transcriptional regulator with XRE-family HTH domain
LPWHATVDAHIGSRVRWRRALLGMSQRTLAAAVGVTYQQVRKYELGINCISGGRLYTIAAALAVPVSFFFDGLPATSATTVPFSSNDNAREAAAVGKKSLDVLSDHGAQRGLYPMLKATVRPMGDDTKAYRIYFLDTAGRIDGIYWFEAEDDQTARWIADRLHRACSDLCASFELRQGPRDFAATDSGARPAKTVEEVVAQSQEMLIRHEEALHASSLRIAKNRRLLEALERAKKAERAVE